MPHTAIPLDFRTCRRSFLNGLVFVAIFAGAASSIAAQPTIREVGVSPLILGLLLGALYANALEVPAHWAPGIQFAAKYVLRAAVVLYGFRLTFSDVASLGMDGVVFTVTMLVSTIIVSVVLGRMLGLTSDQSLLIGAGSAICGASAVASVESTIGAEPHKATVAVATVVVFGTAFMFLLPMLHEHGIFAFSDRSFAIYAGTVTHEVAQVAVIASSLPGEGAAAAMMAKMARVLFLAPLLLVLAGVVIVRNSGAWSKVKLRTVTRTMPWYAVFFLLVVVLNSMGDVPAGSAQWLTGLDNFLLIIAMTALGMETHLDKIRKAGGRPFFLGLGLAVWLLGGGYLLASAILH